MDLFHVDKNSWARIIGKAILLASIQAGFGSIEMSSKYSVINFSKDQETLQNAANALTSYIVVGTFWMLGCSLILFASYGIKGLGAAVVTNIMIMGWIVWSYKSAFKEAARKYNLKEPELFKSIV